MPTGMTRTVASLLVAFIATAHVAGSARDTLEDVWLTSKGEGKIEIRPCGTELCGTVVYLADPLTEEGEIKTDIFNPDPAMRERTLVGLRILRIDGTPDSSGVWRHGRIYDPDSGKTYRCKMWMENADTLTMRGFLGVSLFGRTVRWTRVSP